MFKKALQHFKKNDPKLYELAKTMPEITLTPVEDYFISLCGIIIGQQLSGKAADTIRQRFFALFPQAKPTPLLVQRRTDEVLKEAGLSRAKITAIRDLSHHVRAKKLILNELKDDEQEIIIQKLTQVKGIGLWTSEIFLMFSLAREDIFSAGDLGLLKGVMKLDGLTEKPTKEALIARSEIWAPYRTFASLALWRSLE